MNDKIQMPEKVGPTDRSEAQRLMAGIEKAAQKLREYIAPRMGTRYVDDPGVPQDELEVCLVCPWCRNDMPMDGGVIAIDMAQRWTWSNPIEDDSIDFEYDGHADFDGVAYVSSCCELPVSQPEGWRLDG